MAPMIAREVLPTVAPEVFAFAMDQDVTGCLPGLLVMTRRVFPTAALAVLVEDDPEIANDRHIVFEVDVGDREVSELVDAQSRWSADIFRVCPATDIHIFRLRMV